MIELTPASIREIPQNGPTDPIEYYKRPLVGRLFRERINLGLRMLGERRFRRVLEVGYGSGALLLHIAPIADELSGIDLDAKPDEVKAVLAERGVSASLTQGSVLSMPYPAGQFDLVVCFSTLEHIRPYEEALREISRILVPGGLFLLGMPSVNKMMEAGFRLIGFKGIEDHHVTTPAEVSSRFSDTGFHLLKTNNLRMPPLLRPQITLYHNWLLQKDFR